MIEPKFKPGDKVQKPKGYKFDGIIRSQFLNGAGEIRYVVEMEGNGMLHIFSESQLDFRGYEVSSALIAAAPAMYEILKRVSPILRELKYVSTAQDIESILAAARGEANQSNPQP